MANYGPASAFLLVGGSNISGDVFGFTDGVEQILEEVRGLGESWDRHLPVGIGRNMLETTGGLYDDRTVGLIEALQSKALTPAEVVQLVDYGVAGTGLGQEVVMLNGTYVGSFVRTAVRDGLTKANGVHTITGTRYEGKIAGALTLRTGDGNSTAAPLDQANYAATVNILNSNADDSIETSTPHGLITGDWVKITGHAGSTPDINSGTDSKQVTVIDSTNFSLDGVNITVGGGATGTVAKVSSAGLIADLQVTTLTLGAASNVVVKVRHSSDNVTYADLITFTAVTLASTAERVETTTDAKRYLAISWTGTGAAVGTVTPFVAAVRT
jgi:hypothetical protein